MSQPLTEPKAPGRPTAAVDTSLATRWGEKQFAKIFRRAPMAMSVTTLAHSLILDVNDECVKLLGYARETLIGRTAADLGLYADDEDRRAIRLLLEQQGHARDLRLRCRVADGSIRTLRADVQVMNLDGEWIQLSTFVDETDQARQLRESDERFRAAFKASSDAHFIVERDSGRLLEVNDRFAEVFGYSRTECLDKTSLELGTWAYPEQRATMLAELREHGQVLELEFLGRRKNGEIFPVLYSAVTLELADQPPLIVGAIHDLTSHRALEDQLRQAQKLEAMALLAGGVAHDFNNVLTVVLSASDCLLHSEGLDPKLRRLAEMIHSAGARASLLTKQLLLFSRQQVLAPRMLNLNDVVHDVRKMLDRIIGEDVELRIELDEALSCINADPGQMQQVLLNLAVNARDAMAIGGVLTIATRNEEVATDPAAAPRRYVVLTVKDTGAGMPDAVRQRIFDPFFTTKPVGKGTGLGLAIVHGVVKQSGGRIDVESGPDAGTVFTIHLPAVDGSRADLEQERDSRRLTPGSGTILLVEDDDLVRANVKQVLSSCGYRVLEAANGLDAIQIAAEQTAPIDLLLTDVIMPGMSGREISEQLVPRHPKMGVLYMSGYTDDTLLRRGVQQGLMQLLPKPFTPADLSRAVHRALAGRHNHAPDGGAVAVPPEPSA